ncbi:hypothetical protein ETD86_45790 [Nonomuraea turkmeniaca]|uniref:Uncharacterized protein n=1 Tax=Nonomuraea turkmeniaca TaxID=103838 RepID=A0A5S4EZ22_9ACTN|nr:hypothetical protein [Nonomuraea turkmeniaca]TMR08888.1 hypothetical protein ETD86_45790 [Nonomuraea turkmeniaca]
MPEIRPPAAIMPFPPPGGCRWCGAQRHGTRDGSLLPHFSRWAPQRGFHTWEPRTPDQIRAWAAARWAERRARDTAQTLMPL